MVKTQTEKLLAHKRKRKGVLVPLLEDLFMKPVEPESAEDVEWIKDLIESGRKREAVRLSEPVYSPSALSECIRRVYLTRHRSELSVKTKPLSPKAHYYFATGDWIHVKWQFALYKLQQRGQLELLAVEKRVISKRRDHGGTPDAVVRIPLEGGLKNYLVDFKGLNVRDFGKIARGEVPSAYALQLADYAMLINSSREWDFKVDGALLVVESKGGPDNAHPIALHEEEISIKEWIPEVHLRLHTLREHEEKASIPKPECSSTSSFQFSGCPFQAYCKVEVKTIERRNAKSRNSSEYRVAVPKARVANSAGRDKRKRRPTTA